jgi:pyrroline-5-carboxylate reductase
MQNAVGVMVDKYMSGKSFIIVGGGNMGASMVRGILRQQLLKPEEMIIIEPSDDRRRGLGDALGIRTGANVAELSGCSVGAVLFAIKPQVAESVCSEYCYFVGAETLVLSCMAGITVENLSKWLGSVGSKGGVPGKISVVRFMPNLPAQVGRAMTVYYANEAVTEEGLLFVRDVLTSFGEAVQVQYEQLINSATAVAGSGTGYLAYILEHYIGAARDVGFTEAEATLLVRESVEGAMALWHERKVDPSVLRQEVTSPGGTTEAAIAVFDELGLGRALRQGVRRAYERAEELAK